MAKIPKLDRKLLKTPDQFVRSGRDMLSYVVGARSRWVPIVAVATLVIVAIYSYDWWEERQLQQAWKAYFVAMEKPEETRWTELASLHDKIDGNRAGLFAAVTLADHYFDKEKNVEISKKEGEGVTEVGKAVEWYTKALAFDELLVFEKQLLYVNRGKAYELESKYEEALGDFEKAAEFGGDARGLALLNMGRMWELKADGKKAEEYYRLVTVEYVDSEYAKLARNYLRALKSPLFKTDSKSEKKS